METVNEQMEHQINKINRAAIRTTNHQTTASRTHSHLDGDSVISRPHAEAGSETSESLRGLRAVVSQRATEFATISSAHGSRHLVLYKGACKQWLWRLVVTAFGCAIALLLNTVTQQYLTYQVDVTRQIYPVTQLVFPAVTLCNSKPLDFNKLQKFPHLMKQLSRESNNVDMTRLSRKKRTTGECDLGWSLWKETCLYVSNTTAAGESAAKKACRGLGASLYGCTADAAMQIFINSLLPFWPSERRYYMALYAIGPFKYAWDITDCKSSWPNFAVDPGTDICMSMRTEGVSPDNGEWFSLNCSTSAYFMCMKPANDVQPSTVQAPPSTLESSTVSLAGPTTTLTLLTSVLDTTTAHPTPTDAHLTSVLETSSTRTEVQSTICTTTEDQSDNHVSISSASSSDQVSVSEQTVSKTSNMAYSLNAVTDDLIDDVTGSSSVHVNSTARGSVAHCECSCCGLNKSYSCSALTYSEALRCAMTAIHSSPNTGSMSVTSNTLSTHSSSPSITNTRLNDGATMLYHVDYSEALASSGYTNTLSSTVGDQVATTVSHIDMIDTTRLKWRGDDEIMEIMSTWTDEEKDSVAYSLDKLVLDCKIGGVDCYHKEFTRSFNPVYGSCFTFNSGWNESHRLHYSHVAGRRHGLHLLLNSFSEDKSVITSEGLSGFRLVIHPQKRMSFPENEGMTAAPGQATSIGIRQTVLHRLGGKYKQCVEMTTEELQSRNMFVAHYPVAYSQQACEVTCIQNQLVEKCGCADASYMLPVNTTPCYTRNDTQSTCANAVKKDNRNNVLSCDCPVPCREYKFATTLSIGKWPSNVYKRKMLSMLDNLGPFYSLNQAVKDWVKIEVYYEELNEENLSQKPAYPSYKWLSRMGGGLGLFLGCSIVTIVEIISFFIDVLVLLIIKCTSSAKPRS